MRKTIRRNRCGPYRRYGFTALRIVLGALAAVMLFLAGAAVVRSVRTARLNSRLSELHDASGEETDPQNSQTHNLPGAGTAGQAPTRGKITGRPSLMGCPDGSAIREYGETAPLYGGESNTVFHKAGPENAVLKEMQNLKRINRDTVGWIQIGKVLYLALAAAALALLWILRKKKPSRA